ncbi:hypothetical protein [Chitinimonas sp.]|uniref:hypothetical protein n=1 Tax=Chitinimonas sp. TaxID=1934313 RepID=UPI0035B1F1D5
MLPLSRPIDTDSEAAASVPQFFVSVINESNQTLTLAAVNASAGCGWVQEPYPGETLAPGDERVWCGMPAGLHYPISLHLVLSAASGGEIHVSLQRPAGAAARLQVDNLGADALLARALLQRADSSSPFVMVLIGKSDSIAA